MKVDFILSAIKMLLKIYFQELKCTTSAHSTQLSSLLFSKGNNLPSIMQTSLTFSPQDENTFSGPFIHSRNYREKRRKWNWEMIQDGFKYVQWDTQYVGTSMLTSRLRLHKGLNLTGFSSLIGHD